ADLDAFYASVEQRDDPRLRGRPVIVGGGVVLAASYEAKAFGVRTAMAAGQALRLCPRAVVVPPRIDAYVEASRATFAVFDDTTPLVEGLSIDEAFLDVGGLRRSSGPRCGTGSGWPSPSAWPARSSWPRWPAPWPSPTGCWWWPPTPSSTSSIPWRWNGSGASGGSLPRSSEVGGSPPSARWRRCPKRCWWPCSARRRAATSTPWRRTGIPARCRPAGGDGRSAPSTPSAAAGPSPAM